VELLQEVVHFVGRKVRKVHGEEIKRWREGCRKKNLKRCREEEIKGRRKQETTQ